MMKNDQSSTNVYVEEDEQNITLEKRESCPEKQPIDSAKQPVEILQTGRAAKGMENSKGSFSGEHHWMQMGFSETSWMNLE